MSTHCYLVTWAPLSTSTVPLTETGRAGCRGQRQSVRRGRAEWCAGNRRIYRRTLSVRDAKTEKGRVVQEDRWGDVYSSSSSSPPLPLPLALFYIRTLVHGHCETRKHTYVVILLLLLSPILVLCSLLDVRLQQQHRKHIVHLICQNQETNLLLLVAQLLPSGTEQLANLSEPGIGVLSLDTLPPVLAEEHVRREGTFRCFGVLLGLAASGRLLSLLGLAGLDGPEVSTVNLEILTTSGVWRYNYMKVEA